MHLASMPRPDDDTGIGFHYAPRRTAGDADEMARWVPQLRTLGASWLVVRSGLDRPLSEPFVRQLVQSGIEPVILVPVRPIRPIDPVQLRPLLRLYAEYGVRYVALYHQPNRIAEWSADDWTQPDLVGRFMALWAPAAWEVASAGLYPVFPALQPGGHYWDTAFLASAIDWLAASSASPLLDRLAIGVQNLAFNRPLTWGAGGPSQWRDARPYAALSDSEDQRGFRLYDWYDAIVQRRIGYSLPLLSIASGAVPGDREDPRFGPVDVQTHAERNAEMARQMVSGELPDALLNLAFWTLTGGGSAGGEAAAWFKVDGQHLPAADLLRQVPHQVREPKAVRAVSAKLARLPKPLHHYLLFAAPDGHVEPADWKAAAGYITRFQPTAGFRLDEALQAEHVTIVGGPLGVSPGDERLLRQAGCHVERIGAERPRDTQRAFKALIESGRRFRDRPNPATDPHRP